MCYIISVGENTNNQKGEIMNYCNIIVSTDGSIVENTLVVGNENFSVGAKAEEILIDKAKSYAPSGLVWDDDIENEMLENGYIQYDNTTVSISWPGIENV